MKVKIVRLVIKDDEIQNINYLVNPDKDKLAELKYMIEHRFDYEFENNLSNEAIKEAEEFCDNIWNNIERFIEQNFVTLDIDEEYQINY